MKKTPPITITHPHLIKEWDITKNGTLTPLDVTKGSHIMVWWKCWREHVWKTRVNVRTEGWNCPECSKAIRTSFPEQAIFFYMLKIFNCENRKKIGIGNIEVDIHIPEINLSIEYDGENYHKNKVEKDILKSKILKEETNLLRIREYNLPDIMDTDCIF